MKVNALLKRVPETRRKLSNINGWTLDELSYCLSKADETIQLTKREWQLLDFMLRRPDQFIESSTLLNRVWETDSEATSEALRTCIKRLRKKLDATQGDSMPMIESIKGLGYRLNTKK